MTTFLFDVDGTLVDSNDAHAKAWQQALAEVDCPVDYETIRRQIGMGGDHIIPIFLKIDSDSAQGKKVEKRRSEIFKSKYLETLKAFSGAADLLRTLKAKGYELIIATSSGADDLKALLKQTGLDGLIPLQATATDAEASKPDPSIIEAALAKSKHRPESAIMVGDTPYDIQAARRAGVRTLALCSGGWEQAQLNEAGAWQVFVDPATVLTEVKANRFPAS